MEFIKKHKSAFIVLGICLVLILLVFLVINTMFMTSKDKYGNRLKDAPNIEETMINDIKSKIENEKIVESVSFNINAVTMKFFINVKSDTKIEDAQKLGDIILKNMNEKVVNFYDIEIYLIQKEGKDSNYPAIGYHSKIKEEFSWVINKGETDEKQS